MVNEGSFNQFQQSSRKKTHKETRPLVHKDLTLHLKILDLIKACLCSGLLHNARGAKASLLLFSRTDSRKHLISIFPKDFGHKLENIKA